MHSVTAHTRSPIPARTAASPLAASVPVWKTSFWHAGRETVQIAGKTAGLLAFTSLAQLSVSGLPLKFVVGGIGALSAGTTAYLIAKNQIGTETTCQKAAVFLCTAAAATAGAAVATFGTWQMVTGITLAGLMTPTVSLMGKPCNRCGTAAIERAKAGLFALDIIAGTAGSFAISSKWSIADETLAAKNLGAALESLVVELCKSSFERVGLSVNRNVLSLEGKALASAIGMLPYVGAALYINGFLATLVQPPPASRQFFELLAPVLLSTLVNAVRGACNSAAVRFLQQHRIASLEPGANEVRPHHGLMQPNAKIVAQKTAIRFFLITCRNAVYLNLCVNGLPLLQANCLAQLVYSLFAQNRELIFDLMQGQAWTMREDSGEADAHSERVSEDSSSSSSKITLSSVSSSESESESDEGAYSDLEESP
jgi:hypothetical protein